ncbi:GlsB/YeaQ/YmgE family stress response membrane protein [Desulfobulbus sp. US1]|nr:GlsB/YeaQ/YmgE family stress response membrane protein [Desulfobulbus sp. US4]MCW5204674.1 GlsB/YeaQ/YmgE family stress response membrane protein [Desulfobulbus sp. N2]MCW5207595.1 GlsB/YeaQ/YmgE family stress response membrane protein [Desulfobulbus sp. US2]MCW5208926.1 GlsB/YeaQ/YmgE family stress response membrane protein [Desulfobulbus sp. US1]MCW5210868.1 GlsB/YeaQ/YmgE family stress response membrane protein [Desulfobulbus sp. N3]WLE98793.1 MAG: GlsB/YeaQ/YmgE family stress response m
MDLTSLLIFLGLGALAGWLAGKIIKGGGSGLLMNIVIGIIGSVIGGWAFGQLGIPVGNDLVGSLVTAVVGAIILLFIVGLVKK